MQLYSYYRSSAAYRVRIALELKGLEYEYIPVNLLRAQQKSGDYLARNPQGLVPALQTGEGELIPQSVAIMEWLEETCPTPALLPADPLNRARVRSLVNVIACDIHPINNMSVTNFLQNPLGVNPDRVTQWYAHWIDRGFAAIETGLRKSGGLCCFGDQPTLADACLVPQVYNALRFDVDMTDYTTIMAVWEHCNSLEAFSRAHPDAQPDAPDTA